MNHHEQSLTTVLPFINYWPLFNHLLAIDLPTISPFNINQQLGSYPLPLLAPLSFVRWRWWLLRRGTTWKPWWFIAINTCFELFERAFYGSLTVIGYSTQSIKFLWYDKQEIIDIQHMMSFGSLIVKCNSDPRQTDSSYEECVVIMSDIWLLYGSVGANMLHWIHGDGHLAY